MRVSIKRTSASYWIKTHSLVQLLHEFDRDDWISIGSPTLKRFKTKGFVLDVFHYEPYRDEPYRADKHKKRKEV